MKAGVISLYIGRLSSASMELQKDKKQRKKKKKKEKEGIVWKNQNR